LTAAIAKIVEARMTEPFMGFFNHAAFEMYMFFSVLIHSSSGKRTAAILSRIPIKIVDRFIAIFGSYGISLVLRKCVS